MAEIERESEKRPDLEADVSRLLEEVGGLETEESRQREAVQELTARKIRIESSVSEVDSLRGSAARAWKKTCLAPVGDVDRHRSRLSDYDRLLQDADSRWKTGMPAFDTQSRRKRNSLTD